MGILGQRFLAGVVFLFGAVLLFANLDREYLWQDEAATAVLGERLMRYGKPLAFDGKNIITMDSFVDEDVSTIGERTASVDAALRYLTARRDFKPDTTWTGHPWGQFVIAGTSLELLGHSTFAARAPFALASLVTIVLLYVFVLRLFVDRTIALLASALLTVSGFWVLHGRQARYYALSSLCLLLLFAAFARWRTGARHGALLFVVVGWCYFQCDYGSFVPAAAVLCAVAAAADRRNIRGTAGVFAALGLTIAPFVWYYELVGRVRNTISSWPMKWLRNFFNLNEYVLPCVILLVGCWLFWRQRRVLTPLQSQVLGGVIALIVTMTLWVPAVAPAAFLRYIVQLTPLASLLSAWTIAQGSTLVAERVRRRKDGTRLILVATLAAVVGLTNLFSLPVGLAVSRVVSTPRLDLDLLVALRTVFTRQPDPNREVIERVAPLLRPGDEILVNYEDIPFMFYTEAAVRGGVAAFRVEDRSRPPPRFLVLRQSVPFVHWPVFLREVRRHTWHTMLTGAPDVPFGANPDPTAFGHRPKREVFVAERFLE